MNMNSEKAKVLVDLCVAISFLAISFGKYLVNFVDVEAED